MTLSQNARHHHMSARPLSPTTIEVQDQFVERANGGIRPGCTAVTTWVIMQRFMRESRLGVIYCDKFEKRFYFLDHQAAYDLALPPPPSHLYKMYSFSNGAPYVEPPPPSYSPPVASPSELRQERQDLRYLLLVMVGCIIIIGFILSITTNKTF